MLWSRRCKISQTPLTALGVEGFEKNTPSVSQEPSLWEEALILAGEAAQSFDAGGPRVAAAMLFHFDLYARPAALTTLLPEHVTKPPSRLVGSGDGRHLVTFFPSSEIDIHQGLVRTAPLLASSKTDTQDDTVALGLGDRFWLNDIMAALLASSKKGEPLFGVEYDAYKTYVGLCCGRTGTRKLRPHQFRHGGASLDMANGVGAAMVKARGRWKSDSTLHRFSKVGRYFRLCAMLPPASVEHARRAQVFLSKHLAANIRRHAVQKFPSANSR